MKSPEPGGKSSVLAGNSAVDDPACGFWDSPSPRRAASLAAGLPAAPAAGLPLLSPARPARPALPDRAQCPNKSVGANIPFASKWASASSTVRKILVAVSVMNGLGFFFGFHTT